MSTILDENVANQAVANASNPAEQEKLVARYNTVMEDMKAKRYKSALAEVDSLIKEYPASDTFKQLKSRINEDFVSKCAEDAQVCLDNKDHSFAITILKQGLEVDKKNSRLLSLMSKAKRMRNRRRGRKALGIITLLLILGGIGAYYFLRDPIGDNKGENEAWAQCERYRNAYDANKLEDALEDYLDDFPNGLHSSTAKSLLANVKAEKSDWKITMNDLTVESLNVFMDKYKNGFFHKQAYAKLDSITFYSAKLAESRDQMDNYLSEFPDGKYVAEAEKLSDKYSVDQLSPKELDEVEAVVRQHFQAIGDNDETMLRETIESTVNSYYGKINVPVEDVVLYMNKLHDEEEGGAKTVTYELADFDIKKINNDGANNVYSVKFTINESKEFADNTLEQTLAGTAIVNNKKKITSLVVKRGN